MHGVLTVDKPSGPTSHDIVKQARTLFRTREVGHAGTLDPLASGVLLLLFGDAAKLSRYLTAEQKTYSAVVRFGVSTDTLDRGGAVTAELELHADWLSEARLQSALDAEVGRTEQQPPAFSAIKVGGQRAHRLSRKGEAPELAPRTVKVERLRLAAWSQTSVRVELTVSKGFYVRSFARDLGERLGVPAMLDELRRTHSGSFGLDEATAWPAEPSQIRLLSTSEAAKRALPAAVLTGEGVRKAELGQTLGAEHFVSLPDALGDRNRPMAWHDLNGNLVALGAAEEGRFAVVRGFPSGRQS